MSAAEYESSKLSEIDHLVGHYPKKILLLPDLFSPAARETKKIDFITRLINAQELPDYQHVNGALITELIALAQDIDWNNPDELIAFVNKIEALIYPEELLD